MAHDVFVSYASADKPTADAICARLEEQGIRCWYAPRDIPPGASWSDAISAALEGAEIMVVVFSSRANESDDVAREVELAAARKMTLIPVRIEDVTPTKGMDYFLSRPHWLDALTPPLDEHIDRLAQAVKPLLASGGPSTPIDLTTGPPEPAADPGGPVSSRRGLGIGLATLLGGLAVLVVVWAVWLRSSPQGEEPAPDPKQATADLDLPVAEEPPREPDHDPGAVATRQRATEFIIVADHSKKCLEVRAGSHDDGATIEQQECSEPPRTSQRFRFGEETEEGTSIVNVETGQCLEVQGASLANLAMIQQTPCAPGIRSQLFKVEAPGRETGDRKQIRAVHSGKCLFVPLAKKNDGVQLVQWDCQGVWAPNALFSLPTMR